MANEVIDFERKGNVIRFYIGENGRQWGDDWNDCPYDCNAGAVYNEFIEDEYDISIPFDWQVLEPCDGVVNCNYSKQDMIRRLIPCLILVPPRLLEGVYDQENFYKFIGSSAGTGVIRVYFGDTIAEISERLEGET